jgi:hypothetical protein
VDDDPIRVRKRRLQIDVTPHDPDHLAKARFGAEFQCQRDPGVHHRMLQDAKIRRISSSVCRGVERVMRLRVSCSHSRR